MGTFDGAPGPRTCRENRSHRRDRVNSNVRTSMRSDRKCGRRWRPTARNEGGVHYYFFFTYHLTNCVVMPMLIAELLSDTMESTWAPRRGWANVVPGPRSLRLCSASEAMLGHRRSVASNFISKFAVAGGIVPRKPYCSPELVGWRAGTRGSPPRF